MTEFGTTRTIVVFGIVVACFAVLWPKLFYPIFFAGNGGGKDKSTNIRQERSNSLHDGYLHPAFKEKGSAYYAGGGNEKPPPPVRTIDKELKPGPVPGMRPAFGGGMNHIPQQKGAGSMGILMPLYTIGISVFFLYTITKVLFKKKDTENHQSHFQRDRSAIEETLERSKREVLDSSPFHRKYEPPCVTPPPPKQLANGSDAVLSKGSPTFRENAKLESQAEAAALQEQRDFEIYLLKKRLEDTEKALERIFMQMEILSNTISKEIVQRDYYQQPRNSPDKPEPTQEESKEVKLTKAATNDDGAKDEC